MFLFNIFFSLSYWTELPLISCFYTTFSYHNRDSYKVYQTKSKKIHEKFVLLLILITFSIAYFKS